MYRFLASPIIQCAQNLFINQKDAKMAAKHEKENRAFAHAMEQRDILLGQVKGCKSTPELMKLGKKQKKLEKPRQDLTLSHSSEVGALDLQITEAFIAKSQQFIDEMEGLVRRREDEKAAAALNTVNKPEIAELVIDAKKEKSLAAVRAQIDVMHAKAAEYKNEFEKTNKKSYLDAYNAAQGLIGKVESLVFLYTTNKMTLAQFKTDAGTLLGKNSVDDDVKELSTHRGWKEILTNLLAAAVGTVIYLAAAAYTGSLMLFKPDTRGTKIGKSIGNAISEVADDNEPDLVLESSSLGCHK